MKKATLLSEQKDEMDVSQSLVDEHAAAGEFVAPSPGEQAKGQLANCKKTCTIQIGFSIMLIDYPIRLLLSVKANAPKKLAVDSELLPFALGLAPGYGSLFIFGSAAASY